MALVLPVKPARVSKPRTPLSSLITWAGKGRLAKVVAIVEAEHLTAADLNGCNSNKLTPLCAACESGVDVFHLQVVSYLLGMGVDVNRAGNRNFTPLMLACGNGHTAAVKVLLAAGASTESRNVHTGSSALHFAAGFTWYRSDIATTRLAIVTALLDAGASILAVDSRGRTALHVAAAGDGIAVLEVLIAAGLDVDVAGTGMKLTPLHLLINDIGTYVHYGPAKILTCQRLLALGEIPVPVVRSSHSRSPSPLSTTAAQMCSTNAPHSLHAAILVIPIFCSCERCLYAILDHWERSLVCVLCRRRFWVI